MSAGAPRGLASSGQKPIAEILHPLSAAEEPLSVTVNVGGDKVRSAGSVPRPVWRFENKQGMERGRLTKLSSAHEPVCQPGTSV